MVISQRHIYWGFFHVNLSMWFILQKHIFIWMLAKCLKCSNNAFIFWVSQLINATSWYSLIIRNSIKEEVELVLILYAINIRCYLYSILLIFKTKLWVGIIIPILCTRKLIYLWMSSNVGTYESQNSALSAAMHLLC